MEITVEVLGQGSQSVEIRGETYADILQAVDLSPQEATVLVDGRPVPEDAEITEENVQVLRLIAGG